MNANSHVIRSQERSDFNPVRAVVFDLDGLMFNTEDIFNEVGHEVLRRRGKQMTRELLQQMMGRRAPEALRIMAEYHQLTDTVPDLIDETRTLFFELAGDRLAPMPGLFELLAHIESRALPKAVATSSGRRYLEQILGRFELMERFHLTANPTPRYIIRPHNG
jgi:beta-phosphoglucomutase-like phosphatase (HAD superfamily)